MRKDQLEARIALARTTDWCDEEGICRERAAELGIELDERAIEREVAWRRANAR